MPACITGLMICSRVCCATALPVTLLDSPGCLPALLCWLVVVGLGCVALPQVGGCG
jgi:hypothetical protein